MDNWSSWAAPGRRPGDDDDQVTDRTYPIRAQLGFVLSVTAFHILDRNAIIQAGIKRIYTHDNSFWNDDPADADHSRKKRVLREARIKVDAPYLEAFKPSEQIMVPKKPPVRDTRSAALAKIVPKQ